MKIPTCLGRYILYTLLSVYKVHHSVISVFFADGAIDTCYFKNVYENNHLPVFSQKQGSKMRPTSPGGTSFLCPNRCGRKYKYYRGMRTHFRYECSDTKQFHCQYCNKSFSRKSTLKSHLIIVHKILVNWYENKILLVLHVVFWLRMNKLISVCSFWNTVQKLFMHLFILVLNYNDNEMTIIFIWLSVWLIKWSANLKKWSLMNLWINWYIMYCSTVSSILWSFLLF